MGVGRLLSSPPGPGVGSVAPGKLPEVCRLASATAPIWALGGQNANVRIRVPIHLSPGESLFSKSCAGEPPRGLNPQTFHVWAQSRQWSLEAWCPQLLHPETLCNNDLKVKQNPTQGGLEQPSKSGDSRAGRAATLVDVSPPPNPQSPALRTGPTSPASRQSVATDT